MKSTITIIGTGTMGTAIIVSLIRAEIFTPSKIIAIDTDGKKLSRLRRKYKIKTSKNIIEAIEKSDMILLAVKPQMITQVCENWKTNKPIISILAGTRTATLKKLTGSKKIIDGVISVCNLPKEICQESYNVLENCGNLSLCSTLLGLSNLNTETEKGSYIGILSFGNGFKAGICILEKL